VNFNTREVSWNLRNDDSHTRFRDSYGASVVDRIYRSV